MNYGLHPFSALPPLGPFMLPIIIVILAWTAVIKGIALWKSARNSDEWWFIVLLIVNTLGILELIYLLLLSKKTQAASVPASSAAEA